MTDYAVAHIDEIEEISDGRCPFRPVRPPLRHHVLRHQHVDLSRRPLGDRLINEHDEDEGAQREGGALPRPARPREVRARRRAGATRPPARSSSSAPPSSGRRSPRSRGRRSSRSAARRGRRTRPSGGEIWMPLHHALRVGRVRRGRRSRPRADRGPSRVRRAALQPRVLREPRRPDGRRDQAPPARDRPLGAVRARSPPRTPTSTRSATRPRSRSWFPASSAQPAGDRAARARDGVAYVVGWTTMSELPSGSRSQNIGGTGPP